MGDVMRQVPFRELIKRVFEELKISGSIFGIPESQFYKPHGGISPPYIGPAPGPHTQLAQNIITSYMTGGRFIELKTVQIMDRLEIPKPCIDASDEGYNTEWSTEYTLEKAYDEYLKAWFILHILENYLNPELSGQPSFIFNMSVGYDLEGIKNPKMDRFINSLMDASDHPLYKQYLTELGDMNEYSSIKVSPTICRSVTLSTMHGCPPDEIEAICRYIITVKKLDTYVKLNPTLLGFSRVREILDNLGFDYIVLKEESFDNDLQYSDAVNIVNRLMKLAEENSVKFGIKLTNTLGTVNTLGTLPGDEMYMSGRALYPLSINLAALFAKEFNGMIKISFSGGATAVNIKKIFETGISPVTIATDLLKPGGYLRLREAAIEIENYLNEYHPQDIINVEKLEKLAEGSLTDRGSLKELRGSDKISVDKELPLFDCYIAPCVLTCPIHQDIPEYIKLVGEKRYREALEVIYQKNALPGITGYICDNKCIYNCTRLDYEDSVQIREMKKIAVDNGWQDFIVKWKKPEIDRGIKIAVIGSGPAGLSAAYFLAKEGFTVTIFEKENSAGGIIENILPGFRIPDRIIEQDVSFIKAHGVNFIFNWDESNISGLKEKGFKYICVGIGAGKGNILKIDGDNSKIIEALDFLRDFKDNPGMMPPGRRLGIIGAGNTAMDSARAAIRLSKVETVDIFYRRSLKEMPADREEYEAAVEDGVKFHFLRNPVTIDDRLHCTVMKLGERDSGGRARPEATDKIESFNIDTIITAIGEHVDNEALLSLGIKDVSSAESDNVYIIGDAAMGSSSIVRCIADARKAADKILEKENISISRPDLELPEYTIDYNSIDIKKGQIRPQMKFESSGFSENEASRCLECNYICNKCVDVCPNRSNIAIPINGFNNKYQIIHIDAFCNECGNCSTFCPYNGDPYKDKLTLFSNYDDFSESNNSGFFIDGDSVRLRVNSSIARIKFDGVKITGYESESRDILNAVNVFNSILKNHSYLLGDVL